MRGPRRRAAGVRVSLGHPFRKHDSLIPNSDMFHCHNAEHEDMGMMANFETI